MCHFGSVINSAKFVPKLSSEQTYGNIKIDSWSVMSELINGNINEKNVFFLISGKNKENTALLEIRKLGKGCLKPSEHILY